MHTEEIKKIEGMEKAARNAQNLKYARELARYIATQVRGDRLCSSDDVRMYLQSNGQDLGTGNWWGSLFKDGDWEPTDIRVKAKHDGSHAREVRVWRLVG